MQRSIDASDADGSHRTEMEKLCFEFIRTDIRPYTFTHFSSQTAPGAPSSNSTNLVWSGSTTCLPHRVLRVGLEGANHTEWVALPVSTLRTKENMLVSFALQWPHHTNHHITTLIYARCQDLAAIAAVVYVHFATCAPSPPLFKSFAAVWSSLLCHSE